MVKQMFMEAKTHPLLGFTFLLLSADLAIQIAHLTMKLLKAG